MRIQQNFLKVFTGLSLGLGIISSGSTLAATVTYDFTIENLTGKLKGNTYHGYLQYDDSLPDNHIEQQGFDSITSSDGSLKFSFNFLGNNFNETHDDFDRTTNNTKKLEGDVLHCKILYIVSQWVRSPFLNSFSPLLVSFHFNPILDGLFDVR